MLGAEHLFRVVSSGDLLGPETARRATYFAPLEAAIRELGVAPSPCSQILGACASSTLAIGLGLRWLELDRCDLVLAGGYDGVSVFVAAGFEALLATSATRPRPFRIGRDGMALGEGAAIVALARQPSAHREAGKASLRGWVLGFGAATDAVHVTAPDRTGASLARAAELALADAGVGPAEIDLVSAHATATPFNDAAEAKAIHRVFAGRSLPVVHPFKAQIGHTLGAAGVLESLAIVDAMARDVAPAAAGDGPLDPDCAVPLRDRCERQSSRAALKISSAFGGANAALVWSSRPRARPARLARAVYVRDVASIAGRVPFEELLPTEIRHPNLGRVDPLGRLVLAVVGALFRKVGAPALSGAGIVVGHGLASLETNALFDARCRERGARRVEPRRFPATSPNVSAGECAIAFRLTGPSFSVGASLHGGQEALEAGRDLVASGDTASMVVVGVDLDGPLSRQLLLAAGWGPVREGACAALLSSAPSPGGPVPFHLPPSRSPGGYASLLEALESLPTPVHLSS
jgi:3-oxoacyl-[acyl-carrier-protein] synthase II